MGGNLLIKNKQILKKQELMLPLESLSFYQSMDTQSTVEEFLLRKNKIAQGKALKDCAHTNLAFLLREICLLLILNILYLLLFSIYSSGKWKMTGLVIKDIDLQLNCRKTEISCCRCLASIICIKSSNKLIITASWIASKPGNWSLLSSVNLIHSSFA